jgi:hypothetical protein
VSFSSGIITVLASAVQARLDDAKPTHAVVNEEVTGTESALEGA